MALIIQDPVTPVNNANSYQSLVDARSLAVTNGVTLPSDDTGAETALINARAYIDQHEADMCGTRSTEIQNTAYPRQDSQVRGVDIPSDSLPADLLISQIVAAEAFGKGVDLFGGTDSGKNIASETVGKISRSYFDNGKTGSGSASYPRFDNAIKPLLCTQSIGFPIGGQIWL